jgi:large subunit ribosomal protein L31
MKEKIHPKFHKTVATCACGAQYEVGSSMDNIRVDICSACHPLFTGKQKLLDAEGRVQKFQKKYAGVKVKKAKPSTKRRTLAKKKSAHTKK